jgi:hypothetical protein
LSEQTNPPPPNDRYKAEMPLIPGVTLPGAPVPKSGSPWLLIVGSFILVVAVLVGARMVIKSRRVEAVKPVAQIDVPPPVADLTPSVPVATAQNPAIATTSDFKPWNAVPFTFHVPLSGENVPAMIVRLPSGSPTQASAYWSFATKAAYGTCQLEYVEDLQKLKTDYGFGQAKHPMVGNPCTRSLYDPLKYATLAGNVLARGAVVQGSDLRPPLGIEIKLRGKEILATRME